LAIDIYSGFLFRKHFTLRIHEFYRIAIFISTVAFSILVFSHQLCSFASGAIAIESIYEGFNPKYVDSMKARTISNEGYVDFVGFGATSFYT
jgi:hypothetical protein